MQQRMDQSPVKWLCWGVVLACLAGCSVLKSPTRPGLYDFGRAPEAAVRQSAAEARMPLVLAAVRAPRALEAPAVMYRLAYSNEQQLRPYSQARWSMPAADLLQQRVRDQLGLQRTVLGPQEAAVVHTPGLTLRLDVEELSHVFETPQRSVGVLRMRATVTQWREGRERLVGQRQFAVQKPSVTADAAGGVQAMAQAVDATITALDEWLQSLEAAAPKK